MTTDLALFEAPSPTFRRLVPDEAQDAAAGPEVWPAPLVPPLREVPWWVQEYGVELVDAYAIGGAL